MSATQVSVLSGRITARRMRPTRRHRLAISPGILGTVYAVDEGLEARYFDYDLDAAVAFAGITPDRDPRFAPPPARCSYVRSGCTEADARPGRQYVWILKQEATP